MMLACPFCRQDVAAEETRRPHVVYIPRAHLAVCQGNPDGPRKQPPKVCEAIP